MRMLAGAALIIGSTGLANAATVVSGSDTFSAATGLYTYNYTVENTGPAPKYIDQLFISVNFISAQPPFISTFTSPAGSAGWIFDPATSFVGTGGYSWFAANVSPPLPVGDTLSGFSFSVPYAPSGITANNYFVVTDVPTEIPNIEFGNTVAPLIPSPTPLPATLPLFMAGLGGLGWLARRRRSS
jgi:hypothetical protein